MSLKSSLLALANNIGMCQENARSIKQALLGGLTETANSTEDGGTDIVKIWENPDHTQTFAGQTLKVDVSGKFSAYIVLFGNNQSTPYVEDFLITLDGVRSSINWIHLKTADGTVSYRYRDVTITTNDGECDAVFSNVQSADNITAFGSAITTITTNARSIPYAIYGIR